MSLKVIYSGFVDERALIIDYLKEKHDWVPIFLLGLKRMRRWAEENYGSAVFADQLELRLNHFDYSKIGTPVPIDNKILDALAKYALICCKNVADPTGWNFSFDERRQFYYDTLRYWNTVICNLKPDLYVSWTWPHTIADYTLYILCKHYYNIPTIFSDSTPYLENYSAVHDNLENLPSIFEEKYNSRRKFDLSKETIKYLSEIRGKKGKDPEHILDYNKFYRYSFIRRFASLIKNIPSALSNAEQQDWKRNKHPQGSSKSQMNVLQMYLFETRLMINNNKVYKLYSSYVKKPDLNKKYILFPASYQPEATTMQQCGPYDNLLLILDLLSASLPKNWVIYYKEYPLNYLQTINHLSLARNKHYYDRIASFENVQMIPSEMDIFELIDKSQAVATATGTVGWEAVVRGIPVLIFGSVWYGGCKSIFKIYSYQDCLDAINKIKDGYKPDQEDVERYAAAIEQSSHKIFVHLNFSIRIKSCPDKEYEMHRIAQAFYDAYESYYCRDEGAKTIICNETRGEHEFHV